ncbi:MULTISPECIES: hypothetical protein [Stenotrophomonas]|uniref:Helix-turn-helix domain-containing protein n=1 Tax=Stenotrophomonas lactitubi TaxID=2045214 RepID=A0AAW4GFF7_9GAMM|nr:MULTISPECIES: hypothetical protein [Stenotrophomonas]MBM9912754.1 hypothetical protein [Stenotrophomonas lactitubi]MBM9922229.1 hypothetical protein [Stenotrophomonas lactitubi]MBM9939800.1 hypothetical protein [Stenotrophomonas lactitubi]
MKRRAFYERQAGAASPTEFAFQFVAWMQSRRTPATPSDLLDRYGMCRATAYRYLRKYQDAFGEAAR